jgi:hypothetical protein
MRNVPLAAVGATSLALAALILACGKSPTSPGIGQPPPPNVTPERIEITGPRSVPPGSSARFSAVLYMRDGSSRDVTAETSWSSRTPDVISASANGTVTAIQAGDGTISAVYQREGSFNATKEVIVVPEGTYRLAGLVTEAGAATSTIIVGARVEVISGTGAGLFAMTGNDGRYRLYGVAGSSQIQVTRNGYDTSVLTVSVVDHTIENVELRFSSSRDVAGTYALTISAASNCRGVLPDEAMSRSYTAVVTQQGSHLETTLTGSTFARNKAGSGDHFPGRVDAERVTFTINTAPYYNYYPYTTYYPDVVEQLTSGYLILSGRVTATTAATGIAGALDGVLAIWPNNPTNVWRQSPTATCESSAHQFVLARR